MDLQSLCCCVHNQPSTVTLSPIHRQFSYNAVSPSYLVWIKMSDGLIACMVASLKRTIKKSSFLSLNRGFIVRASNSDPEAKLNFLGPEITSVSKNVFDGLEPFRGKPGSVSFNGLTHQLVEEGRLVSNPFKENTGSFLWILAPVALISSLLLLQFFLGIAIDGVLKDEILSAMVEWKLRYMPQVAGLRQFCNNKGLRVDLLQDDMQVQDLTKLNFKLLLLLMSVWALTLFLSYVHEKHLRVAN